MNPEILNEIIVTKMPYGKYKGTLLYKIPMFYLEWYYKKGFPSGKLGMQLSTVYEIKLNGLDEIFYKLEKM
jgi:uncharacterized protein